MTDAQKTRVTVLSLILGFMVQAIAVAWFLSDLSGRVSANRFELGERRQPIKMIAQLDLRLQWLDKTLEKLQVRMKEIEKTCQQGSMK